MSVNITFSSVSGNYSDPGSLITQDSSTGVIYVLHWYRQRCTFLAPPPKYKYSNHGVQSINALRNLNALTEVFSSSISASESLVLGTEAHCKGRALFKS